MTDTPLREPAFIEKAAAQLLDMRPAYASILGFYGPVFAAQARAAGDTSPAIISVDETALDMRRKEGFSLIERISFSIDNRAAEKLLAEICDLAAAAGEKLSAAGKALAVAMGEGASMAGLFVGVLEDNGRIQALADETDVPSEMLSLLVHLAIRPSIEAGALQLAEHLDGYAEHRSNCPICGSAPILGELDADGKQWVHCSLCWHRWSVERMACLSCGNRRSDSLEYLFSEDEPEYRVYLCKACKHYLKVVDTRQLTRGFFAPLEQVVSLHLDMMASENGYVHAMAHGAASV